MAIAELDEGGRVSGAGRGFQPLRARNPFEAQQRIVRDGGKRLPRGGGVGEPLRLRSDGADRRKVDRRTGGRRLRRARRPARHPVLRLGLRHGVDRHDLARLRRGSGQGLSGDRTGWLVSQALGGIAVAGLGGRRLPSEEPIEVRHLVGLRLDLRRRLHHLDRRADGHDDGRKPKQDHLLLGKALLGTGGLLRTLRRGVVLGHGFGRLLVRGLRGPAGGGEEIRLRIGALGHGLALTRTWTSGARLQRHIERKIRRGRPGSRLRPRRRLRLHRRLGRAGPPPRPCPFHACGWSRRPAPRRASDRCRPSPRARAQAPRRRGAGSERGDAEGLTFRET